MSLPDDTYDQLIAPIEPRMVRMIARLVPDPDDAADTMQNVLASVWKYLRRIQRHPNPQAYILRLCINRCYDTLRSRYRRRKREVPLDENSPEPVAAGCSASHALEQAEEAERIRSAIATLPPHQSKAVLLRLVEEESFATIAETIGCSEATARSHYSKGRARLQKILGGGPPEKETEDETPEYQAG
jgi:RNA polymerase sigma factor (sigma-70 family)